MRFRRLSVLAPFGRFLEIGKVESYRHAKIGLASRGGEADYGRLSVQNLDVVRIF